MKYKIKKKILLFSYYFWKLIYWIKALFSITSNLEKMMQSGELIVTGHDKVIIHLSADPLKVTVKFKDICHVVPCNPHHHDHLEYEIKKTDHHRKFILEIKWKVSGIREIIWSVYY